MSEWAFMSRNSISHFKQKKWFRTNTQPTETSELSVDPTVHKPQIETVETLKPKRKPREPEVIAVALSPTEYVDG